MQRVKKIADAVTAGWNALAQGAENGKEKK